MPGCEAAPCGARRDGDYAMNEFQTHFRRLIALGAHIRWAFRRKGLRYLARRAWSKIGLKLGWSNAGLGRELGRTYAYQDWVKDHPTWAL